MDITDPEILRAERFGGRFEEGLGSCCCFCGKELLQEYVFDGALNLYCDDKCKRKRYEIRKEERHNDKKRAYANLLSEQGDYD